MISGLAGDAKQHQGVWSRALRTWRRTSDAGFQQGFIPRGVSLASDDAALFFILLISPKLLLPEMTWQLLRPDGLWFLVQEVFTGLQIGIIIRVESDHKCR